MPKAEKTEENKDNFYDNPRDNIEKKRISIHSKRQIRSLRQYKDMSDEEFDELWARKIAGVTPNIEFEKRIEAKLKSFAVDYDLDDLKANDKLTLRALAQAFITLDDLEHFSYTLRGEDMSLDAILTLERINNIMSTHRKDISVMQNDLKITRKTRKGEKEETVLSYIENLKTKAKKFYEAKMSYVFCEKCNMLLATLWAHYPDGRNKMSFTCHRPLEDGEICGHVTVVSTKDLYEKRGSNSDIAPEYFR